MTLWGDFAEIEGQMLQSLESDKPVLAFCDVKSSIYPGDFVLSATPVSSLLINPQFEKANNLQEWQDMYYKFNAMVSGIDNSTDPWYHGCKKCYMKVTVIKSSATCTYCRAEDIDYEERYRLKIDVIAEDQFLRITLFDAAKYYFGCDVKDYVLSTSEKIDRNFPNVETNMNVTAMEIHKVPKKFAADQTKVKTPIKKQRSKRMKKLSDNKKMKEIAADIPHVEKHIAAVETDTESPEKTNRCKRTKKIKEATTEENPQKSDDGENVIDEIQTFQDARWVSPPEALWRIYEFSLIEMQPAVINLKLHLLGKHSVFYWKNQNLQNVIAWDGVKQKMLTEYFRMCSIGTEAHTYLYREFPKFYVWNSKVKTWTKRKTRSVIDRIAIGEMCYERLLPNHVRGPLSFNDLLTVNGKQCQTFKEVAKERGLLESDNNISECLRETVIFKMPSALRSLFATILIHCNPTDIRKLWDTYYEDMSEDFNKLYGNLHNTILHSTLNSINNCLQSMGKSINIYDIPQLDHNFLKVGPSKCREINEEMFVQIPTEDFDAQSQLNQEQDHAFTKIMQTIDIGIAEIFFVDGSGELGKHTYTMHCLPMLDQEPLMEKIQFTINMRARTDPTFSKFLLRVGNRDEPIIRDNLILLPEQLTVKHSRDGIPEESIIKEIFPNLQENAAMAKYVTERAILASRNDHMDKLNDKLISMFPGESKIFNSFDSAEDETNNYYQEEYLNTLTPNGLLPHRLELKENAPIVLLRNLDPSSGLCLEDLDTPMQA
ncbi:hypothetical protein H5410_021836 [Solanum commersonii]|uniref:DNA helicase Pif1-like 2B domain-containing protein n=1 Tax=Solanum commersonii TaxID=4109 RepID=A0A9J5ZC65_SOLCO|nr:hypothetical protein H5410_021836 [Solanum commersonii]